MAFNNGSRTHIASEPRFLSHECASSFMKPQRRPSRWRVRYEMPSRRLRGLQVHCCGRHVNLDRPRTWGQNNNRARGPMESRLCSYTATGRSVQEISRCPASLYTCLIDSDNKTGVIFKTRLSLDENLSFPHVDRCWPFYKGFWKSPGRRFAKGSLKN